MSKAKKVNEITIRQVRSAIGRPRNQRQVLDSLGLRRIRHEVVRQDTAAVRGMVAKIPHLVEVVGQEAEAAKPKPKAAAVASASEAVAKDASTSEAVAKDPGEEE